MRLWFACMVKDEEDTIGGWIRHAASEGATGVAILNNRSTDGTLDAIADAALDVKGDTIVWLEDDPVVGYYQSLKISALLERVAREHDPEWIVPADADELWHARDRALTSLFVEMRLMGNVQVVDAGLLTHYATGRDDPDEPDPFRRLEWRHPDVAPLPKVAFKWATGAVVHQGNHGVTLPGVVEPLRVLGAGLTVRHFPYRSPEQFERKVRNGAAAYAAAPDLPAGMGNHWRDFGDTLERGGPDALRAEFDERFYWAAPEQELLDDPAPYERW